MLDIKSYFQKFLKIQAADLETKENISAVIKKIAGVQIEHKNISLQDGLLRINASPAQRQQIFLYKSKILSELTNIRDIR
ncbi:MAG: hypothetical protein AAB863_03650 [Patescibacteria group bacterium]